MSTDLRTQLVAYGEQIRDTRRTLTLDEVMFRGDTTVVVDGHRGTPTRRVRSGLLAAAAILAVLFAGVLQAVLPPGRSDPGGGSFGVFEPIRGWIVYPVWTHLEAVNPDNPSSRQTLDLPFGVGGAVPVGWSADGSLLALDDEDNGLWHVLDQTGEVRFRGDGGGCCLFVTSNWLSPDGESMIVQSGFETSLGVLGLESGVPHSLVDLDRLADIVDLRHPVWSPNGTEIAVAAVTVDEERGQMVLIVEVETGAIRELVDSSFGYVRHVAWSPDGTQLLVTAGDRSLRSRTQPSVNPLVAPLPTRLYLVNVDGSGRREIASGYFVATAWSPDGTRIAALEYSSEGRSVVLMGRDGSGPTTLPGVEPTGPFTAIAWHPRP